MLKQNASFFAAIRKLIYLLVLLLTPLAYGQQVNITPDERPNIVWIVVEDTSPSLVGAYGGLPARTPNIDRLAEESVRFVNAFAINGACAPNRSAMMTGLWPPSYGAHHMRTMQRSSAIERNEDPDTLSIPLYEAVPPPEVRFVSEYLRMNGYYALNEGKHDYQFKAPAWVWSEDSHRASWQHRTDSNQPFFAFLHDTGPSHESNVWRNEDQPLKIDPSAVEVPPYYPDTPIVRRDIARYYDNVAKTDSVVGTILDRLRSDNLLDETIIFFFSDHGTGLPRMKRTVYDSGLRIPLIVRVPEKYQSMVGAGAPGTTSDRLVSILDFAPTLLSLAGIEVPGYMQGRAFLGPQEGPERDYIYAHRDRMPTPVLNTRRAVRDGRFKYIRDYRPEKPFLQFIPYRNREGHLMREILRHKEEGRLDSTHYWQWLREDMPKQELYDTKKDLHEIHNLAGDPRYTEKLTELRRVEQRWWQRTNDMGLIPEPVLKNILWPPWGEQPTTAEPMVRVGSSSKRGTTVRLESATGGASIGYKRNGDTRWRVYHEPLTLANSDTLRAKAHRMGYKESKMVTWTPQYKK